MSTHGFAPIRGLFLAALGVVAIAAAGAPAAAAAPTMAVDCDASVPGIQANCDYSSGATFSAQVHVTEPPATGYLGFQTLLTWTDANLGYIPRASADDEVVWPDSFVALRPNPVPPTPPLALGGLSALSPPYPVSTHVGAIVEVDLRCQQDGMSSLDLIPWVAAEEPLGSGFAPGPEYSGTVTTTVVDASVNCLEDPPDPDPRMKVDCDASAPGIQSSCNYSSGATFSAQVHVTEPPATGYLGFQTLLTWTDANLDYIPRALADDEVVWPDSSVALRANPVPPTPPLALGGISALSPPYPVSTHVGAIVEVDLRCQQDGISSLGLIPWVVAEEPLGSGFAPGPEYSGVVTTTVVNASVQCGGLEADADRDGCTDVQELGLDENLGGLRNPTHFWDFYDVSWPRDKRIDLMNDIFGVAFRFAANDSDRAAPINRSSDPLTSPPPWPAYHPAFDRGGVIDEGDPWDLLPANGNIDLMNDIFGVAFSFSHSCAATS